MLMIQIQPYPYAGTAYLCGAAHSVGHDFELIISNDTAEIINKVNKEQPDLIGFSCMTGMHVRILELIKEIKKNNDVIIILGGPHPTFFPEIIKSYGVDIICRGEGEFALIELLNAIESRKSYFHIKNLWVKNGDKIYENELRPLVEPLDNLPLIDWSCYRGPVMRYFPAIAYPIRGCPFSCAYCFNERMRTMYKGLGHYIRHFSVERAIEEVKVAIKEFSTNSPLIFGSDSFGIDLPWMSEFFQRYSEITDLPFVLLLRPELATDECIEIISKHKCFSVGIGVESGSERVRKDLLNRNYSNKLLIDVAKRLHDSKIKFRTYNIIGIPGETEEEMFETILTNVLMHTDYPRPAIFSPFPGTKLTQVAIDMGYLPSDFSFDSVTQGIHSRSVLQLQDKKIIINTLHLFQTFVLFPKLLKISRFLDRIPPNPVYKLWFMFVYAVLNMKSEGRRTHEFIKFAISNRKYFMG